MPLAGASNEGRLFACATLAWWAGIALCATIVPVWDRFVLPRRWLLDVQSGIRATHDLAQRGVGRSGWESVLAIDWFRQNAVGPPEWEHEAMGSVVWVQCANLCRVCLIYR